MNTNKDFNNFVKYIANLSPNELCITACIFGFLLSQSLDAYSQQSLGNFFELIGQFLLTESSQIFLQDKYKK